MANETKFPKADPAIVPVEGPAMSPLTRGAARELPRLRPGGRRKTKDPAGRRRHKTRAGRCAIGLWGEQREVAGAAAGGAAPARVPIFDRVGARRGARRFGGSSRRTNSGAGCNTCGGTSATRTGICRSSRSWSDGSFDRGSAALRVRHEYLPGVRPVAGRGALAGRAARAVFSLVGAGGRGRGGGEGGDGSCGAGRAEQPDREFDCG